MADASFFQTSFLGGEWSKQAQGRADKPEYRTAMNLCRNNIPVEEGSCTRRPGTQDAGYAYKGGEAVLREFHFTEAHPYTMEFSSGTPFGRLRFRSSTSLATEDAVAVASISGASPAAVETTAAHGWSTGDQVLFRLNGPLKTTVADIAELMDRQFSVTVTSPTTFTLTDAVTLASFDGATVDIGGNAILVSRIVEFQTPFEHGDLDTIRVVQDETEALVLGPRTPPKVVTSVTDETLTEFATFSFDDATFLDGPYLDPPDDGSYLTPGGTTSPVTLTETGGYHDFVAADVGRMIRLLCEPAAWDAGTAYAIGDVVKFDNAYWSAMKASTGAQPDGDVTTWAPDPSAAAWTWGTISSVTNTSEVVVALAPARTVNGLPMAGGDLLYNRVIKTWRLGVYFSGQYASCGTFHEGRLWLGGEAGNRIDSSMSNRTFDMSPTLLDGTVADDCGISATFRATGTNRPLWLLPDDQGIIVGTQAGEWLVHASQLNDPLTPTSIQAHRGTKFGCANVLPVEAPLANVFVQRDNLRVIELMAAAPPKYMVGQNLSLWSKHFFSSGIDELAYQSLTTPIIWIRTRDGDLVGCTYRRDGQLSIQPVTFAGFHKHALGTSHTVRSIQAGPSVDGTRDALSLVTRDANTGYYHVSVMTSLFEEGDLITDAWFLDGAVAPARAGIVTVPGVDPDPDVTYLRFYGLDAWNGATITAWIGGVDAGNYVVASGQISVPLDQTGSLLTTALMTELTSQGGFEFSTSFYDEAFVPSPAVTTYTEVARTAVRDRFSNGWGLAVSPDGSIRIWSANSSSVDEIEAWNNDTQTYIGSNAMDVTPWPPTGSIPGWGMAVTNDAYVYGTVNGGGGGFTQYLARWSDYGAGAQEVMGSCDRAKGVIALKAGDGNTYIICKSFSFQNYGYIFNHDDSGTPPVFLDMLAATGQSFQIVDACLDNNGEIWLVGGLGDLAADQMMFWCYGTGAFFQITLPAAISGTAFEAYVAFADGHFIVNTQQGDLLAVETNGTISHTVTGPIGDGGVNISTQMHTIRPVDTTFFIDSIEYSASDLSVIGPIDYSLWGVDGSTIEQGTYRDWKNNGFFVGYQNANNNFAWLLTSTTYTSNPLVYVVPAVLGWTYTSGGQIVRPIAPAESGAQNGPAFAKTRRAHMFGCLLNNAQGVSFGTRFDKLRPAPFKTAGGTVMPLNTLFSGTYTNTIEDDFSFDSMLCWQITRPYPATVLTLGGFLQTQDR